MADIFVATLGSPMPTAKEVEAARKCITEASFKKLEKLLALKSPDKPFRKEALELVVIYRRHPDPAACERKDLKSIRAYFHDVLQHLQALQERLPGQGKHDLVQSNFLLEVLGQGTKTRRRCGGHDYLTFRTALNDFTEATQAASLEMTKKRLPPNLRLEAEKWLVRRLAEIFQKRTGRDPRDHVESNYAKSEYRGAFFEITDEVLRRVGHRQTNTTRGRMIRKVLENWPKMSRPV